MLMLRWGWFWSWAETALQAQALAAAEGWDESGVVSLVANEVDVASVAEAVVVPNVVCCC
jgi:hypothetical protein